MSRRNSAIRRLAPDCEYIDNGGEITVISGTMPSDEEIQAKIQELTNAEPLRLLREERNRRLQETDWWCCSDQTPTQAQLNYRQALRDLPSNVSPTLDEQGNLTNVTWPTKPE